LGKKTTSGEDITMSVNQKSPKLIAARDSLDKKDQIIFLQLVEEYAFFSLKNYGRGWVAYDVLADLVRSGWRPSGKPA